MSKIDLLADDMQPSQASTDSQRFLEICNACRYCETYCAVFPSMTLQRSFSTTDMDYFANLCHNCKGCFQACQFAPPHEFGINLPKAFAEVRNESYARYAWPSFAASLFEKNGTILSLSTLLIIAMTLITTIALRSPIILYTAQIGEGAFYKIIPWDVLIMLSGASFMFSACVITISLGRFWRATKTNLSGPLTMKALLRACLDIATLRYLGNEGHGCNDLDDSFASYRRNFHHLVMYGFALCFAATLVATFYDHILGLIAPYPLFSLPVLLGTLGGIGLVIGCVGLVFIKIITDPLPVSRKVMGGDYAFITLLLIIALTGLALLMARTTSAMGILFAIHFGAVLAFFLMMPYSKFVHGLYRGLALIKAAIERDRNKPLGE